MVRAILEGRKSQTRRVVKSPIGSLAGLGFWGYDTTVSDGATTAMFGDQLGYTRARVRCPYGQSGDRLWVRETFTRLWFEPGDGWQTFYKADDNLDYVRDAAVGLWHPSIHMPRAYSRITLEITDVRVEQVQEVSEADAEAEGVTRELRGPRMYPGTNAARILESHQAAFARLWDAINAKRGYGWDSNPWVWVISFRRVQP